MQDLYTQYRELKRKVPIEEISTNDLLPQKKQPAAEGWLIRIGRRSSVTS